MSNTKCICECRIGYGRKNVWYKLRFFYAALFILATTVFGCRQASADKNEDHSSELALVRVAGKTMGTTYDIQYFGNDQKDLKPKIDSILDVVNDVASTYIPNSMISKFNAGKALSWSETGAKRRALFVENLEVASRVFKLTEGYYDPTIMPLVQYWGFGPNRKKVTEVDQQKIGGLLQNIGFKKVHWDEQMLTKDTPDLALDFSSCAKGQGVDQVAQFLTKHDVDNFMVNIGGEMRVQGKGKQGRGWVLGINLPEKEANLTDYVKTVVRQAGALATSGNYRNFYEVGDKSYGHTINPKTGYPEQNDLLSATILTDKCIFADALATGCMAQGFDRSKKMIQALPNVEAVLIYRDHENKLAIWQSDDNL